MIWLLIPVIILIPGLTYLLFAPFYLEINSRENLYGLRFHRLASARLHFAGSSLILDLKIAGWNKQIDMLAAAKPEKKRNKVVKHEGSRSRQISLQKMIAVMKSFHVKKFFLTIDTGSNQANGILYPWFMLAGIRYNKNLSINFIDENILVLQIKNNMARVLWAFIKS